jgi:hypothetical protein
MFDTVRLKISEFGKSGRTIPTINRISSINKPKYFNNYLILQVKRHRKLDIHLCTLQDGE